MTEHLNSAEQTEVFQRHIDAVLTGSDEEYRTAAEAICSTATNHKTGFALAYPLGGVIRYLGLKIHDAGQRPVTAYEPQTRDEVRRFRLAARFIEAAAHGSEQDMEPAYALYCRIESQAEHDGGKSLAALYFILFDTVRQMAQQLAQAIRDQEATA